jgi:hypothetical protein
LQDKTDEKEQNLQSLLKRAESGAEASAKNAAQAGDFFNKTDEAYKKALALSTEVEGNASRMKSMLEEARGYADSSAQSAGQASDSQNRTYLLHNEMAVIFQPILGCLQ